MHRQSKTMIQPTIEEVHRLFEQWREGRTHRTPIPDNLWAKAVSLSADHSIHRISKSLRLNYSALMRRVCSSGTGSLPEPLPSHAFIELDMKASTPGAEYVMEKENRHGSKMKMHIRGSIGTDPLGIIRTFWESGL
ncbi:MAG TPA: hypothetical protein PLD71_10240 [Syntrophales bacterium]|nr:hypothetical protein [Syntrophales bacterium]